MTLIILVRCNDGIVLAADRAQSEGEISRREVRKIHRTKDTVVAFAGRVAIIEKASNIIESHANGSAFDINQIENQLVRTIQLYASSGLQVPIEGFIVTKSDGEYRAFKIESDGICYPTSGAPYDSTGAGIFQANPLLDQRISKHMTVEKAVPICYSVISDVARFNPTVSGPPNIFVFRKDQCVECGDEEIARAKQEVEYSATLSRLLYDIINERNLEKIGKITETLKELATPQTGGAKPAESKQP